MPQINSEFIVTPVAISRAFELFPQLSNSGDKVAFARAVNDEKSSQIVSKDLLTDKEMILTKHGGLCASPVWSPDDSKIAFLSYGDYGCMVGVMSSQGGPSQLVAPCSLAHAYSARSALDWLNDGETLVVSQYLNNQRHTGLFLHELSSGNVTQLTFPEGDSIGDFNQTVSPDGERIAFTRAQLTGEDDLYLIHLASNNVEKIEGYFGKVSNIDWTNNNSLIYVSNKTGRPETWQFDLNTKQQRWYGVGGHSVANVDYNDVQQKLVASELRTDWIVSVRQMLPSGSSSIIQQSNDLQSEKLSVISRDGKSLAYTQTFGKQTEIWRSKIDGSDTRRLAKLWDSHINHIAWSPDETRLLLEVVTRGKAKIYVYEFTSQHFYPIDGIKQASSFSPIWGSNNELIYYSSPNAQGWTIWQHKLSTGKSIRLTDAGGRKIQLDDVSKRIYFVRPKSNGMWYIGALDSILQRPMQLTSTSSLSIESWLISENNLYYVPQSAAKISTISSIDLVNGNREAYYTSPKRIIHFDVWGDTLSTSEIERCEGDIYLYELLTH